MSKTFKATRKKAIIAFLKEYIPLALKYKMCVVGTIGAETTLFNDNSEYKYEYFKGALRANIGEIISGLFDDSGDCIADEDDKREIWDAIKYLFGKEGE